VSAEGRLEWYEAVTVVMMSPLKSLLSRSRTADGLDDLVLCNVNLPSLMFVQHANNSWSALPTLGPNTKNWRNARVADVTGDGFPDIVVVGFGQPSYVRVFQGSPTYPHYNFQSRPYFHMMLPFAAPDVEILDVNDDGMADIYIVQLDETANRTNYCSYLSNTTDFYGDNRGPRAPDDYTPPLDQANDVLLIANSGGSFDTNMMNFSEPGCGWLAERFGGGKTMILAQGSQDRPGHNLLLQW
jgi:hypothetical protein